MKKSKVKFEVKKAMKIYYKNGFTNTAMQVNEIINKSIDKLYNSHKQNKR